MTTVGDILQFMETVAPGYMKESWDNVGLLCGRKDRAVSKILVALDPFDNVIQEAIVWGAELIVTHHAVIFRKDLAAVTDETETGRNLLTLIEHNIAAINAHTNLDCAPGGVNDVLAQKLELSDIQVLNPVGTDEKGRPYGLIRTGIAPVSGREEFLRLVRKNLGCDALRYVDGGKPVRKVAVGGGSCAGALQEVAAAGCDTFVTADVKYNQFRDAFERGITLVDAGHFHTENPTMPLLAAKLQAAFPEIAVKMAENHGEVMKFFC